MKRHNWGKCRKCGKDHARIAKNIANLGTYATQGYTSGAKNAMYGKIGEQHPAFGG